MSEEKAVTIWQGLLNSKQTKLKYRNAFAGDGAGSVDVDDEPGYIWCRYSADQSKVSKVFSMVRGVPEDFPIQVGRRSPDDEFEQVLWIDWTQYQDIVTEDTVNNFNTSNHGESHNAASGADPAPIDLRNILEMRGRAQDTPDLTITVERGQYIFGGTVKRYPSGSVDLTASVPGVVGHRFVLVYVNGATNLAETTDGTIVPLASAAPIPDLTTGTIPVCLVDLENGQTTIVEDDIYDWRFLWELVSSSGPTYIGTNAERLALTLADLAELTRFYTTDTDKIWEVWEGAWRLIYPPAALSDSAGNSGTPWATDASGNLIGDDGAGDSPQLQLIGGSNDDTADIFLDDSGVANESDLAINLPGTSAASVFNVRDQTGSDKMHINAQGATLQFVRDAVTNTFSLWSTMEHSSTGLGATGLAGRMLYRLENAGNAMVDAGAMQIEWEDATAASEDTVIRFYGRKGGAVLGEFVHFGATEAVFNEGSADIDFRVETNGLTHALFIEGSTDRVGINTNSPGSLFHVAGTGGVILVDNLGFYQGKDAGGTARNIFGITAGDDLSIGGSALDNVLISVGSLASAFQILQTTGNVGIGGVAPGSLTEWNMSTENLEFVDAGSAGATEQDWIEVQVGNVTGYIRVFAAK